MDPDRPPGPYLLRSLCIGFRHVNTLAVCVFLTRLYQASGSAVSPAAYMVPWVRFTRFVRPWGLLTVRNPRYGWLVRPYPAGTSTRQETPRFAWRTLAVGTPVTQCPPHSPGRADFPHPVPRLYSLSRRTMPYANTRCCRCCSVIRGVATPTRFNARLKAAQVKLFRLPPRRLSHLKALSIAQK